VSTSNSGSTYVAHTHGAVSGTTASSASSNVSTTVTSSNIAPASGTMVNGNWRPAHVEIIACSKD
jgi:hypothetical protein